MLVFAAFPLETLPLEPLGPHVGQFAEGNRVADDAKFAIDEIAIVSYPSVTVSSLKGGLETPLRYRQYRKIGSRTFTVIGIFPIAPILTAVPVVSKMTLSDALSAQNIQPKKHG